MAIDRGGVILVPARELEGCGAALDDLWQSKPELVIDNNCEPLQCDAETNESLGYEKFPNTLETAVHQALREWKLQQEAK